MTVWRQTTLLLLLVCTITTELFSLGHAMATTTSTAGAQYLKQRVAAILWDVDGTLSDSFQLGFGATRTVLERNGIPSISEDDYHAGTKYTTPRRLAWHVTGNPDDAIGTSLGQQFDDLYVALVSRQTAPLYPGIADLLVSLQQQDPTLRYAALSNACGAYVKAVCDVNDLSSENLFPKHLQLGADEVPEAKPSGLGLLHCCSLLQIPPEKCIYIGDSPSDAAAALNAKFLCSVGCTWGSHSEENVRRAFTHTAHGVQELGAILLALMKGEDLV